jgi:hypothetical protein
LFSFIIKESNVGCGFLATCKGLTKSKVKNKGVGLKIASRAPVLKRDAQRHNFRAFWLMLG